MPQVRIEFSPVLFVLPDELVDTRMADYWPSLAPGQTRNLFRRVLFVT